MEVLQIAHLQKGKGIDNISGEEIKRAKEEEIHMLITASISSSCACPIHLWQADVLGRMAQLAEKFILRIILHRVSFSSD